MQFENSSVRLGSRNSACCSSQHDESHSLQTTDGQGAEFYAGDESNVVIVPMVDQNQDYPQTEAEALAGVTPADYSYEPYDVRRYGAAGSTSEPAVLT